MALIKNLDFFFWCVKEIRDICSHSTEIHDLIYPCDAKSYLFVRFHINCTKRFWCH